MDQPCFLPPFLEFLPDPAHNALLLLVQHKAFLFLREFLPKGVPVFPFFFHGKDAHGGHGADNGGCDV